MYSKPVARETLKAAGAASEGTADAEAAATAGASEAFGDAAEKDTVCEDVTFFPAMRGERLGIAPNDWSGAAVAEAAAVAEGATAAVAVIVSSD